MYYGIGISIYLIAAFPVIRWCVKYSAMHGVESTFTRNGLCRIIGEMAFSPIAILITVPFAIAFWPLLCLMDLSEIPQKKRRRQKSRKLQQTAKTNSNSIAADTEHERSLIGQHALTLGTLSPMGQIQIGDIVRNAKSRSELIDNGRTVLITGLQGTTFEVKLVKTDDMDKTIN